MQVLIPWRLLRYLGLAPEAVILLMTAGTPAHALPPGRSWTPPYWNTAPGHNWLAPHWLDTDPLGVPIVLAEAISVDRSIVALRWTDSLWAVTWKGGFQTSFSWPIPSPPGTTYLLWKGIQGYDTPTGGIGVDLVMTQLFGHHIGELDTLGRFPAGSWSYGAAVSTQRRWVAVGDKSGRDGLRLFYSDRLRSWTEVETGGSGGGDGVAVTTLDDTTALVAWAGLREGLRWGTMRGAGWGEGLLVEPRSGPGFPRFRRRPSGGHWLVWQTLESDYLPIRSYRDGAWAPVESLRCAYPYPTGYWSGSGILDLSRDGAEYPAVVWTATDQFGRYSLCVCMPTDSGFTVADWLPYSWIPTITRDRDGEVWLAGWDFWTGMFWIHTYNRATAENVRIEGHGRNRRIAWTLSEPAPETWWAVLRARGREDFEPVARVRAGPGLDMSWTDTSPPAGLLRYKIRRESVDRRYEWESPVVRTPERSKTLVLRAPSPWPVAREGALQLFNASDGPLELRLYDLQGRMVLRESGVATGSGEDVVRFDLAQAPVPISNGIYFAVVRDSEGKANEGIKLVVLR